MAKRDPIGVRLEEDEEVALRRVAKTEGRSLSAMCRRALVQWLRDRGHLPPEEEDADQ